VKHVIIGSGAAGISAAKTLRDGSSQDEIVVISSDEFVYSRCMLHQFISGEREKAALAFVDDDFFTENQIKLKLNTTITKIDNANKLVLFDGGSESYDRLLIAVGSKSFFPAIDGLADTKNVYGLRNLSDAKAICAKSKETERIVIIGAGLVGMDAAYGLLKMKKKPTVVELSNTILSTNLDARAALTYQEKFEAAGCVFRLSSKVSSVVRNADGFVTAVTLENGEQIACDLLIVAAGVRPSIGFVEGSGIASERGITVNHAMETSLSGVYAAGDATGLSESWPSATLQGEIAAMGMLGLEPQEVDDFISKTTIHFFGVPSLSVGRVVSEEGDEENCREDRSRYQKVVLRDGIPVGVLLQGDISRSGFWQHLIDNRVDVSALPKSVWKLSFADSYHIDEKGEYHWDM